MISNCFVASILVATITVIHGNGLPAAGSSQSTSEINVRRGLSVTSTDEQITFKSIGTTVSDKWKRVVVAPNNHAYFVPSTINQILAADISDDSTRLLSTTVTASGAANQWDETVVCPNGKIFMLPSDRTDILVIDASSIPEAVSAIEIGTGGFGGAGLGQNNRAYGIKGQTLLEIDCSTNTVSTKSIPGSDASWQGLRSGNDGYLYGMPKGGTTSDILTVNTMTEPVTIQRTSSAIGLSDQGWYDTKYNPYNQRLYSVPYSGSSFGVIITKNVTGYSIDTNDASGHGRWAELTAARNGKVYCSAWNADTILVIDPVTNGDGFERFDLLPWSYSSLMGAIDTPAQKVIFIPHGTSTMAVIDYSSGSDNLYTISLASGGWYRGALVSGFNKVYGSPRSADELLVIESCVNSCPPSPTPTPTSTPTTTATPTSTRTPTPTSSVTPTRTSTPSPTQTATNTPTPSSSQTPTNTPTPSSSQTPTNTPTPSSSQTPTNTPTPSSSQTPTNTPTPSSTITPTSTSTPSPTQTSTSTSTSTNTCTSTATSTSTSTATSTSTSTATPTSTSSPTATSTSSATATSTSSSTSTASSTSTSTSTSSATATSTSTSTSTASSTSTSTSTPTSTSTSTSTSTPTSTTTSTTSPTATSASTSTSTASSTSTFTSTSTSTSTSSSMSTSTSTSMSTSTSTSTSTPTSSSTGSSTSTSTPTNTATSTTSSTSSSTGRPTSTSIPSSTSTSTTTNTPTSTSTSRTSSTSSSTSTVSAVTTMRSSISPSSSSIILVSSQSILPSVTADISPSLSDPGSLQDSSKAPGIPSQDPSANKQSSAMQQFTDSAPAIFGSLLAGLAVGTVIVAAAMRIRKKRRFRQIHTARDRTFSDAQRLRNHGTEVRPVDNETIVYSSNPLIN